MGRRQAGFRRDHRFSHQKQTGSQAKDNRKPYTDIVKENEKFIKYYSTQNVCKQEEFDDFITSLKTDLPATFRITGSKGEAQRMLEIVQGQLIEDCLKSTDEDGKPVKMFPLSWYPNKLAWQMELTRKDIRRFEAYYKLHNFLISETEHGTISRQETVSMIPPLLLDVKPHHKVLDMCAAPGSKTAQLLEMLHAQEDDSIPTGYVIANDVDNKRCYMLVHQAKRLNSPCVAVINHDSAVLPNLMQTVTSPEEEDGAGGRSQDDVKENGAEQDGAAKSAGGSSSSTSNSGPSSSRVEPVQFDRILCDVPCSGDGTLRKNPDIWMKWTPANGLNLHGIQMRIIKRGAELLSVGGRLVYSTCSINPIENEAVIHRILAETDGALRLVDVSEALPGLKSSPGMEDWLVSSRNLEFYKSFEEVDEKWSTTIRPQMFPPKPEDREKYNLKRCMRILPHHQNTGAFFVAVLEKLKPLSSKEKPAFDEGEVSVPVEVRPETESKKRPNEDNLPQNQRKKRRKEVYKEDPFVFFKDDEQVWTSIKSFYEISDRFESKNLLTRCAVGKKKNIYLTSTAVRDLVIQNQNSIKFINTGVKAFVRCDNKNMRCDFRIANDGLESIYPYIGEGRKVVVPKDDLVTLLLNDNPEKSPPISTLSEEVQKQVENLSAGSCVLIYKEEIANSEVPLVLHISGWRGATSLRCYMTKHSVVHLLRLLGGDTSKYDKNKFKKPEDDAKEEEEDNSEEVEKEDTNGDLDGGAQE